MKTLKYALAFTLSLLVFLISGYTLSKMPLKYSISNCDFVYNPRTLICFSKIDDSSIFTKAIAFTMNDKTGTIILDDVSLDTLAHEATHSCFVRPEVKTVEELATCVGNLTESLNSKIRQ